MSGMFDREEWDFECKRDEKAAKELEEIQIIRDNWKGWAEKRYVEGYEIFNENVKRFSDIEAQKEIDKLKEKWKQ